MLLNIALILYVAVCLYLCLRNKKALYRSLGGGRQFTQSSKSGANTGESGFFLISGYSDTGVGGDSGDAGCGASGDAGGGCGGGGD